jgi:hypothetical protein
MADIRTNIFGIGEVYELQKEGQWISKNRESYREYGYFGGGLRLNPTSSTVSNVDRIDYSNDTATASVRGPLSSSTYRQGACGNSNFGYHTSGRVGPLGSRITRIDYSNDNLLSSGRSNVFGVRWDFGSAGNSNFGYFGGGALTYSANPISTVERLDYSNDLINPSIRGSLSNSPATFGMSAVGNSNFGWFISLLAISRINYSNDLVTSSSRSGSAIVTQVLTAATGNSNFGYSCSGNSGTSTQRINYSNDLTTPSIRGSLSTTKETATGNSNFGYFSINSAIDRVDYSNDTATASIRGNLSNDIRYNKATSSASFGGAPVSYLGAPWTSTAPYGYFGGGVNPAPVAVSTVDRIDYANDTNTAVVRTFLQSTIYEPTGVSNNNFGYFGGGVAAPGLVSRVDRIDYANDTGSTSNRGPLSIARETRATGNSNFGYFGGGSSPVLSTIDRISYSNDTVTALTRSILSAARYRHTATGNSNFGYFMGGRTPSPPPYFSTVDRLDYSSDTTNTSVRGPLSYSISNFGSTGNNNFGYVAGGAPNSSIVNRIDYLNDTSTASVRGPLTVSIQVVATGNSNFGYFGLGFDGAVNFSDLYRVDYSNDTQTATVRGKASQSKRQLATSSSQAYGGAPNTTVDPLPSYIRAATQWIDSNTLDLPFKRALGSYGYFGGGTPGPVSTVDRIDYSNDTTTASVRGALAASSYDMCAAGNNNFGYYTGRLAAFNRIDYSNDLAVAYYRGSIPYQESNPRTSVGNFNFGYFRQTSGTFQLNRLDYSSDSVATSSRISSFRSYAVQDAATGNSNFGYFGAGAFVSNVDRLSYANDTSKELRRGDLTIARNTLAATGNSNFGWFCGGQIVPNIMYSRVDRIDYSTDTATSSIRGPLLVARRQLAATGTSNFGYFGAGNYPAQFTTVDRIDYANDTATASVRGPLSLGRRFLAASTNARSS